jgi:hypothetical protein
VIRLVVLDVLPVISPVSDTMRSAPAPNPVAAAHASLVNILIC